MTVIIPVTGLTPELVAVNDVIFPVPLADKPIVVCVFVQLYEVPVPLNVTAATEEPLHTV